ncbi:LysR family transcriptional regulator [Achromobacter anxifer]|uniref:LysR family transcriptional regulator n=1 Tax=Achromobacter anxifer TaxID=1287737 RepID=UPI0023F67D1E|nr:LysR family transcriptional regulator [Achromobacter anxifer]MDF8365355.1 LysR family transcriptional regulator [Achromobacter anxifer]
MTYNLNELRAFLAVLDAGSLGKAADRMSLTQPALSRIVKRLEAAVGEPLFERHSGGMRLTAYGKALAPHAQLLCREEKIARDEMNRMRGLATGALRLGVTAGASAQFIPKALEAFLEKWPGIAIDVVEGIWDELATALENYQVDLVIAPEAPETTGIVSARNCAWQESMKVIVGAGHPLQGRACATMEALLEERWCFVPQRTEPHNRLMSLFKSKGLPAPAIAVSSTSIPLIKSLVAHSGFVSWLTRPMYGAELKAGLISELQVDGLDHERRFAAYHRREGILPGPALRLLDEIRKLARASRPK